MGGRRTVHRLNDILKDDIMPHRNKTGMDYTIQLSTKNYELRELHEDRGYRMNNTLNALRQKDITT